MFFWRVQRNACVETWYCERRFREPRCIYGAWCFSVTYDGGKSPWRLCCIYCSAVLDKRMLLENAYTSWKERRSRITSSFGTKLSKDWDQITESKQTTTLEPNGPSSCTAGAQSLRSSVCRTLRVRQYVNILLEERCESLYIHRKMEVQLWLYLAGRKVEICWTWRQTCKIISSWKTQYHSLIRYVDVFTEPCWTDKIRN